MAKKLLKETKDTKIENDNVDVNDIYKIDFEQENLDPRVEMESEENALKTKSRTKRVSKAKTKMSKSKKDTTQKEKNIIKVVDDEEEIDEIFGNVNKWLTEDGLEEKIEKEKKTRKKRLTKIEDGIKTSKGSKTRKKVAAASTSKKAKATDELLEPLNTRKKAPKIEENQDEISQGEIKIHAENDVTEILLKYNRYKIELQKMEYNMYTDENETSYIIVRDSGLRIVSGDVYIFLQKQGEDYEITTNQDFKINYVIDNITRKDNTVNFKLTNLTEIVASDDGLVFEIDEEKVIENNLEDNHTLVISEEDGKVYLPYTKEDVKNEAAQNKGTRISEIIKENYVLPLDKYKNSIRARFREGYNLMYRKEGKSKRSAIMLGIELMFETNLHPAIISACKNLEELDIYLDCLEDNELEKFSCFKIIYKSLPTLRKKAKFQEF